MSSVLPVINPRMLQWFRWFVRGYLRRHFHVVAVNPQALERTPVRPHDALVIYANHASWWDPLSAIFLAERLFPGLKMYAPIDAEALAKYPMFGRMGFFGIEQRHMRGAKQFLKLSQAILAQPGASLWLTPEGRFADVRDDSAELMAGLSHLAWKIARKHGSPSQPADSPVSLTSTDARRQVWFVPAAVEYTFWEEKQPELLAWFGEPIAAEAYCQATRQACAADLSRRLREAQRALAQAAIERDVSCFEVHSRHRGGTFFVYDWWRRWRGVTDGAPFPLEHGAAFRQHEPTRENNRP